MKTRFQPSRPNRGFTYMTVVITMIVVGLMLAAYLKLVAVQNQLTMRSQVWNRSVPVLEAGIEEAIAHLNKNASPDSGGNFNPNMTTDNWVADAEGGWHKTGMVGEDIYYVKIGQWPTTPNVTPTNFPMIYSTGFVKQVSAFALNRSFGPFLADTLEEIIGRGGYSKRVVQCTTTNIPVFSKGLIAKHGIDMNGNGVFTDSFDSGNPAYSTNKRWDISKHRANGDIASNDTITNAVDIQNANIWGRVATGPFGTVSIGPNGSVGDLAWQNAGTKGIKPGWSTDDMNVDFPDVTIPNVSWSGMPGGSGSYKYVFNLADSYYAITSGDINGKILVTARNVHLWVQTGWRFSGQDSLTIASNASITIYLDCPSADITGQGIINNNPGGFSTADQCYIFGTSKLTTLDMGGNGEATCAVYVPYANVTFHGGGSSDQDFSGAAIVNSIKLSGHYSFHYDEALGRRGLWRGFVLTSWSEK